MPKNPTAKQRRFLFSSGSPLTAMQKDRLAHELHAKKMKKKKKH